MRATPWLVCIVCLAIMRPGVSQVDTWDICEGGNGNTYVAVLAPGISWQNARNAAIAMGGDLASPSTAAENQFVFGLLQSPQFWVTVGLDTRGPWLGGVLQGGVWSWVTGEPFIYQNWAPGEPNGNSPAPDDRLHFIADGQGVCDSTWNDIPGTGFVTGYVVEIPTGAPFPILSSSAETVSAAQGGSIAFNLSAGTAYAGLQYWVLGTTNGTCPGLPAGFGVIVPLNADSLFNTGYLAFTITNPNTSLLSNSFALLDGTGSGVSTLNMPPGLPPSLIGLHLDHAYLILNGAIPVAASNPVGVTLVP